MSIRVRVSHVNTVVYGLSERKQVGETECVIITCIRLKWTAFLIKYLSVSLMLTNKRC